MVSIFPSEIKDFISSNIKGRSYRELTENVNRAFGTSYTVKQIKDYCGRYRLSNGLCERFPDAVKKYIEENHKGTYYQVLADQINTKFGTEYTEKKIRDYCACHGLHNGMKKNGPIRKPTEKPVGYEYVAATGYVYVKLPDGRFVRKHRHVWESVIGPIPKGHKIIFLDGDSTNCTLENLALVSLNEHTTLIKHHLRFSDPELTRSGVLVAKVFIAARDRQREMNQRK